MRIAIDCRFWGPADTGLGVYTQHLVENLAKIDQKNDYYLLFRSITGDIHSLPINFHKIQVEAKAYTFREQILVAQALYRLHPDLVHFVSINIPIFYVGKYVVTVHDLIKHFSRGPATSTHSSFLYWLKYYIYLFVTWVAVTFSQKIIVPSQNVKKLILNKYAIKDEKVLVTYEAAGITAETKTKVISLPEKFALYVGNPYPHKNLVKLIAAWPRVYEETATKLVLVCGRSVFTDHFEKLVSGHQVERYLSFLGAINNEELAYTYRHASIYVFPTLMEGFGLTGLDAMSLNLPVACSDIPVLREVYGPAASYFNPTDKDNIAKKCIELLTDQKLRQKLINLGQAQSRKYHWSRLAAETLKVYESSLSL